MDKREFISLYTKILRNTAYSTAGRLLIDRYIIEEGNEEHRENSDTFLFVLESIPPLFKYCVEYVIEHYIEKLGVIVLHDKLDPRGLNNDGKIISIY